MLWCHASRVGGTTLLFLLVACAALDDMKESKSSTHIDLQALQLHHFLSEGQSYRRLVTQIEIRPFFILCCFSQPRTILSTAINQRIVPVSAWRKSSCRGRIKTSHEAGEMRSMHLAFKTQIVMASKLHTFILLALKSTDQTERVINLHFLFP